MTTPAGTGNTNGGAGSPEQPMEKLRVAYHGGDRFEITVRDHTLTVDQPLAAGGEDLGPTPTELFVAGLVSCVGFYARRFLRRHNVDASGLYVEAAYRLATKPARVGEVEIQLHVPDALPADRREALLAVASHCTVHNSLTSPPEVSITLD